MCIRDSENTVPLTAFCTPTGLYEWLVMPQGSSASPGWFVKVINEVIKGLKQVAAYLDDVIVFDSDPIAHIQTIRSLFERLQEHNLKLSPSKARLGATDAKFLGHSISPAGLRPNAEKVPALINMPMPADVKQVRALMSGINYYGNFLPDLSKRLRPINSLLRKGVKFAFTPAMEKLVRDSLGSGRVFSLFDLVSSFHQIKAYKDTVLLTAFCTPTGLYEWLVMPQGSPLRLGGS